MELTDRIISLRGPGRRGPGRPPDVTDGELACLAVAQVLLRCDDERHWLRAALRWLADATPATTELLRLMDATPVPCGTSAVTAKRPDLFGYAGYGYCAGHSRWYWGCKLI